MKRITAIGFALLLAVLMFGCQKTLKGADALIEKARQEIPVSDSENIQIEYAGSCVNGGEALLWFVSGNAYQSHYYLPMACTVVGEEEYRYVRVYKPMSFCTDTAVVSWNGGYAFLVNNPDCVAIRITDDTGTHDLAIEAGEYPYIAFHASALSEFRFLDADGNELPQ